MSSLMTHKIQYHFSEMFYEEQFEITSYKHKATGIHDCSTSPTAKEYISCRIWCSHSGTHEEYDLLMFNITQKVTFQSVSYSLRWLIACRFLAWLTLRNWRLGPYVPPKSRWISVAIRGIISVYLWLYNPLLNLGRFFSFLISLHSW
jgi:hypothetical protein